MKKIFDNFEKYITEKTDIVQTPIKMKVKKKRTKKFYKPKLDEQTTITPKK